MPICTRYTLADLAPKYLTLVARSKDPRVARTQRALYDKKSKRIGSYLSYQQTARAWPTGFTLLLIPGELMLLCFSTRYLHVEPCSVGVSECRAVSEQCRGSVGAVSGQCRPVSGVLDSGPPCTVSSSVGVSGCRSVGVSGSVGVSECRSVKTLRVRGCGDEQASRPYELADRLNWMYSNHQQTIQTACSVLID